jgi:hypothetical protein
MTRALELVAKIQPANQHRDGVRIRKWSLDLVRLRMFERWDVREAKPEPKENVRQTVLDCFSPSARRLAR